MSTLDALARKDWLNQLATHLQAAVTASTDPEVERWLNRGHGGRSVFLAELAAYRQKLLTTTAGNGKVDHALLSRVLFGDKQTDRLLQDLLDMPLESLRRQFEKMTK